LLKGFTLIELMVVVTIIAILAALIVPALQRAQAKSMTMKCISIGRSIVGTIRAYSSNWNGFTHRDPAHYIKDFGYVLSDETGYDGDAPCTWANDSTKASYATAQKIRDFVCPVDETPTDTDHAVPTSFQVTGFFAGKNIMNMTMEANRTLALSELGDKRHPKGRERMERNYVFADMSATLGYEGPVFQGMRLRAWNQGSSSGVLGVAESDLPDPDFETIHAGRLYWGDRWVETTLHGKLDKKLGNTNNDWNWNNGNYSTRGWHTTHTWRFFRVCVRLDGFLKFPAPGQWEFQSHAMAPHAQFGVSNQGGSPSNLGDETNLTYQVKPRWRHTTWHGWVNVKPTADPDTYYKFVGIYVGDGDWQGRWGVYWRNYDNGQWNTDYNGSSGAEVGSSNVYFLP